MHLEVTDVAFKVCFFLLYKSNIYPDSVGNASHYSNKKLFDNHLLKKTAKLNLIGKWFVPVPTNQTSRPGNNRITLFSNKYALVAFVYCPFPFKSPTQP